MDHRLDFSKAELRQILNKEIPDPAQFEAFLIDYFPDIHKKVTAGQNRTQKENVLLSHLNEDELFWRVIKAIPDVEKKFKLKPKNEDNPEKITLPPGLGDKEYIVSCLLNRYSLILGDGHGPGEYLRPQPSKDTSLRWPDDWSKPVFNQWESEQFQRESATSIHPDEEARDARLDPVNRPNYPTFLIDNHGSELINMKEIMRLNSIGEKMINLMMRLLPLGMHIDFSVIPRLEYQLLHNDDSPSVSVVMPRVGRDGEPSSPSALMITYLPGQPVGWKTMNNRELREFFEKKRENCDDEYVVIRPCGGYFLKFENSEYIINPNPERSSITTTDDHHRNILRYGLFGGDADEAIRATVKDNKHIIYADFEMKYSATRAMIEWFKNDKPHRKNDIVFRNDCLNNCLQTSPQPDSSIAGLGEDDLRQVYKIVSSTRREKRVTWWRG